MLTSSYHQLSIRFLSSHWICTQSTYHCPKILLAILATFLKRLRKNGSVYNLQPGFPCLLTSALSLFISPNLVLSSYLLTLNHFNKSTRNLNPLISRRTLPSVFLNFPFKFFSNRFFCNSLTAYCLSLPPRLPAHISLLEE